MEKKYQLTDETRTFEGRTLHRIQALKDFGDVKAGDIGGWVKSERNLSQDGTCWVYDDAKAYNEAKISEQAKISGQAHVSGLSLIFGRAWISGKAWIFGQAWISGKSKISGQAQISGLAQISDNAKISNEVQIFGQARIGKNAYITSTNDYFVIENIGSRHDTTTFYLDKSRHVWVSTGCFNDRLEVFEKAVINTHGNNQFAKEYFKAIEFVKFKLIENNY